MSLRKKVQISHYTQYENFSIFKMYQELYMNTCSPHTQVYMFSSISEYRGIDLESDIQYKNDYAKHIRFYSQGHSWACFTPFLMRTTHSSERKWRLQPAIFLA